MRQTPGRAGMLAALIVLALSLTACGGESSSSSGPPTEAHPSQSAPASAPGSDAPSTPAASPPSTTAPALPDVTKQDLLTAEVPANCELPAQRLRNGETTKGSPGVGRIGTSKDFNDAPFASIDLAKLGYKQMLVPYLCSAGGVSWPETLLLIGHEGRLLASFDLMRIGKQEHATTKSMTVKGDAVILKWTSYEGAGFDTKSYTSTVTYADGKLQVGNAPTSLGPTLDVSRWDGAAFSSPSGRINCHMSSSSVDCDVPFSALKKAPPASRVCPGSDLDVGGVTLTTKGTWVCMGGIFAHPTKGIGTEWQDETGFGKWAKPAQSPFDDIVAVLPYGKALRHGVRTCRSQTTGVTCLNTRTGKGFKISSKGVTFF